MQRDLRRGVADRSSASRIRRRGRVGAAEIAAWLARDAAVSKTWMTISASASPSISERARRSASPRAPSLRPAPAGLDPALPSGGCDRVRSGRRRRSRTRVPGRLSTAARSPSSPARVLARPDLAVVTAPPVGPSSSRAWPAGRALRQANLALLSLPDAAFAEYFEPSPPSRLDHSIIVDRRVACLDWLAGHDPLAEPGHV